MSRLSARAALLTFLWPQALLHAGQGLQNASPNTLAIADLRCEFQVTPLGIETRTPRLSWTLASNERGQEQSAYQVLVASTPERLAEERADLWDSGRVTSPDTLNVAYAGRTLTSRQRCFWKVRVWDRRERPSAWSEPSHWEMGLLDASDWRALWIGDGKPLPTDDAGFYQDDPAPRFRKEFELASPVARARLYVSALGYQHTTLNDDPVGNHHLDPLWTLPTKRVFYATHDVTDELQEGANCLVVELGNGWYNPLPLRMWGHVNLRERLPVGRPQFIAQLEIDHVDGTHTTIASDATWRVAESSIVRNSIYLGEVVDARLELDGYARAGFDDAALPQARAVPAPAGLLQSQPLPPIRATARIDPVAITEPREGTYLVDMGQNFAGWARFSFDVPAGTRITMRYGELTYPDGTLNPMTSVCGQIKRRNVAFDERGAPGVAWQQDVYVARGGGPETYLPRFTFHAFRYVEITGLPHRPEREDIEGIRLGSDVERAGTFECSNDLLQRIQTMCTWTFRSNILGVQSDCPHRERFGYGGDLVATCDAFLMQFDMARFYGKAARDWHDSALQDGMLTDTAPSVGIQYCGVGWAMAHPTLLAALYRYYGDRRLVEEQYATSQRWFELVRSQNPEYVVRNGLHDHEALEREKAPPMVTPLYAESARLLAQLAHILGKEDEAKDYEALVERIRGAYAKEFLDEGTGVIASGIQGAQAFALYLDMLPAAERTAALQHLIEDVVAKHDGHLTTGIFGTKFLLDVLSREGHTDLAYALTNQRTFPSWGHMLEEGATTLWETWKRSDDTFSHDHPMFGSVSQWFMNWLGGIEPARDAVGFDRFTFQPRFVDGLDWVRCSYRSMRGTITCNWKRRGEHIDLELRVPVGAHAVLDLTADLSHITESDHPASHTLGATWIARTTGRTRIGLDSGSYRFQVTPTP